MKLFLNFVQFALPPDIIVPEFFLSCLQLLEELLFAEKSLPAQNGLCEAFNLILFLRWVHLFQGNLDTGLIQLIQGLVQATVIAAAFVLLVAGCLRPISQVEIVVEHPSFELLSKLSLFHFCEYRIQLLGCDEARSVLVKNLSQLCEICV